MSLSGFQRWLKSAASSLIACGVGLFVSVVVLVIFAGNPIHAATDFFSGVFLSPFYVGTFLNTASLLMWAAVGASVAIASGNLNLGGEGQVYLAGFVSAVVLGNRWNIPAMLQIFLALVAACLCGALSAAIPALLKRFRGSSELLTSFLFSSATIPLVDAAIAGPFRDSSRNLLATPPIPEHLRMSTILPPSPMNASFFMAVIFCCVVAFVLYRTKCGRRFSLCGSALEFARYTGVDVGKASVWGMILSGAFHGLTGFFAVLGTYYTCHSGFYSGMGWNALTCALIARANPLMVVPASFLLSWIFTAVDRSSMMNNFSFDMAGLIQGSILFFISAQFVVRQLRHGAKRDAI